ncbi:MAG: type II toxin-antitoxin system VapC family toxin [Rhodopseudomonas sp.]|uniref:type II toxin-antitoxin system VapC family toxin n=1 Tax=Rhodopseudomonas sp. TaxID=1078 RepID=UPI00181813C9|nr:type II toxin-antitoxin system VapC family toxin [Rhodopseudomonas sp.]NVN88633.1 type II toxin-antitoxin system VapC family toxin [Rhodopseudomonas sp.]
MLGIDTNLIVRYLTGDHPRQSAKARALIDNKDVFVSATVLLETEWVLRSVYGFSPSQICAALRGFAGLARVTLEDPALIATALNRVERGMDFADALHLGSAEGCDGFVTFDQRLIRTTKAAGLIGVRAL